MEADFDVIIVGGGIAGSVCAYQLAKAGMGVLVIERGTSCGSKNMTGGRIYTHTLAKVFPEYAGEAPLERKIVKDIFTYAGKTVEYPSADLGSQGEESYSVLRKGFDQWVADQAENEGAMYITGIRVDDLLVEDGKVRGVIAGDEEMTSELVILADGVNSLLAQKLGMKDEIRPGEAEVGAKEVIKLDAAVIEERFGVAPGEGVSWMFEGVSTLGHKGNGFLYTNKDSVSLGILTTVGDIDCSEETVAGLVDKLHEHPEVKPLLEGGKLIEYSAHLLGKGGEATRPKLYGDGVMVIGDAASMVVNRGYVVRGMDLAVESAVLAAETAMAANEAGDYSAGTLASYGEAVKNSAVLSGAQENIKNLEEVAEVFSE